MERIVIFLMLAFLAESFTEYVFGQFVEGGIIKYVALAVGVVLSVNFQADIFAEYFGLVSTIPYFGIVLTGMVLGRGANYLHDFARKYLGLDPGNSRSGNTYNLTANYKKPEVGCCGSAEALKEDLGLLTSLSD